MEAPYKRAQVGSQCDVVAKLAEATAQVYGDHAAMLHAGHMDDLLDHLGQRSAELMELLGDVLNGMDDAMPQDAWMKPIFERAHRMFPVTPNPNKPSCATNPANG